MKKLLFALVAIALAIALVPSRSEALGGEALECVVSGSTPITFTSPGCRSKKAKPSYIVTFRLRNGAGTYGFAWSTNGWPVSSGCGPQSTTCAVTASSVQDDTDVTVSATISQNGQSTVLTSNAHLQAVCRDYEGDWVWC
jgi:hypothetical protein